LREELAMLKGPGKADPRDLVWLASNDICAAETDIALTPIDSIHAIEDAGLAGAIWSDQREQFTCLKAERDLVEHGEAPEAQRQALNLDLSHTISAAGDIA
jgi:hypothetical protein